MPNMFVPSDDAGNYFQIEQRKMEGLVIEKITGMIRVKGSMQKKMLIYSRYKNQGKWWVYREGSKLKKVSTSFKEVIEGLKCSLIGIEFSKPKKDLMLIVRPTELVDLGIEKMTSNIVRGKVTCYRTDSRERHTFDAQDWTITEIYYKTVTGDKDIRMTHHSTGCWLVNSSQKSKCIDKFKLLTKTYDLFKNNKVYCYMTVNIPGGEPDEILAPYVL